MLRQELGDEVFWAGMKTYYNDFKNRNALSEDFKNSMEMTSHQSLDQFFEQWLKVAGQPELSVDWQWNEKSQTVDVDCKQWQSQYIFNFSLELKLTTQNGENADTLIRITEKNKSFSWPINEKPDSLIVDPGIKLLFERK
jgi:aminopeptidase N